MLLEWQELKNGGKTMKREDKIRLIALIVLMVLTFLIETRV